MSLINDALKRAKAAQQETPLPPTPGPQLRPVEPASAVRHGVGVVLPLALAIVALLILFFVWQYAPRMNSGEQASQTGDAPEVRARTEAPQESAQPTVSAPPANPSTPAATEQKAVSASGVVRPVASPQMASQPGASAASRETSPSAPVAGAGQTPTQPAETTLVRTEGVAVPSTTNAVAAAD